VARLHHADEPPREYHANHSHGDRFSRFIAADLNRDGQPLLVAVYTNLAGGAIRVLNRSGQVLAAPDLPGMRGFHATVRTLDLDADGTPEVIAEFSTGHSPDNPDTWVFRWTGSTLQLISPTCAVGRLSLSCLGLVTPIDLTGDGHLSLLDWPAFKIGPDGNVIVDGTWSIYSLNNGVFTQTSDAFVFAHEFRRGNGKPFTSEQDFTATPGAGTLRIINGMGSESPASGRITLNGVEVATPSDFQRKQHVMDIAVTLAAENNLTVRLDGKPGSKITVLVRDATAH